MLACWQLFSVEPRAVETWEWLEWLPSLAPNFRPFARPLLVPSSPFLPLPCGASRTRRSFPVVRAHAMPFSSPCSARGMIACNVFVLEPENAARGMVASAPLEPFPAQDSLPDCGKSGRALLLMRVPLSRGGQRDLHGCVSRRSPIHSPRAPSLLRGPGNKNWAEWAGFATLEPRNLRVAVHRGNLRRLFLLPSSEG